MDKDKLGPLAESLAFVPTLGEQEMMQFKRKFLSSKVGHKQLNFAEMERSGFITPEMPRSQLSEEFRQIKRPLINNAFGSSSSLFERGNLIMVSSAIAGEGKTYTAINLALSMAHEMDHTVLLVDADVLRPTVFKKLGLSDELGLADYLRDPSMTVADVMYRTNIDDLVLIPAGGYSAQSVELLASSRMTQLVTELAERYPDRMVIFDAPPLLLSNEAKILADMVGQIVMVVEAANTPQGQVMEALDEMVRDKSVCLVLNKCSFIDSSGGYYQQYSAK